MPSKNMLPKGQRRHTVRPEYVATRGVDDPAPVVIPPAELEDDCPEGIRSFLAAAEAAGMRLDAYLAQSLPEISRARAQLLIEAGQVRVDGADAQGKLKLRGGERIEVTGEPRPEPLRAVPEDIPLRIVFEDEWLMVVDKAAGMTVHAGAGDEEHNRGTLVNALLFHMQRSAGALSTAGGELRPGIVHRLDKETSGLIVVARDDGTHRRLSEMFAAREVHKTYVALLQGALPKDEVTVSLPIARDLNRRVRMTTRRADGRAAVSHFHVLERLTTPWGRFTLAEVQIETGRTHQIRVHAQSLGHPVVGDTLYGAARVLRAGDGQELAPGRNFLHAARLSFQHPRTTEPMHFEAPLAAELEALLATLRTHPA